MTTSSLEQLIVHLESYLECWKQLNGFMSMARLKKFGLEDENQFLEIKSVLTQELELILSRIDCGSVTREEVHSLLNACPSVRFLGELNDGALKNLENQWHKLFIGLQSILGQLKVKQQEMGSKSGMGGWFKRKAA
jgi:hypothetical protein